MNFVLLSLQALVMNWYIAKIVLKITSPTNQNRPRIDEQFRIVHASGIGEAYLKGKIIGLAEEDPYFNSQSSIQTEFVNVSDVIPIHNFADGSEIYSRTNEAAESVAYIRRVHEKAIFIRRCNLVLN